MTDRDHDIDGDARQGSAYRLYCFDVRGRRLPAEPIDAADDRTAIAIVQLHLHDRCELWQGERLVFCEPDVRRN